MSAARKDIVGNGGVGKGGNGRGRRQRGGEEHFHQLSSTKPAGIKKNNQPTMEDKGNSTNTLSGSGNCIGVVVGVARRVLRALAVAVAEKQQSTNNGTINGQWLQSRVPGGHGGQWSGGKGR